MEGINIYTRNCLTTVERVEIEDVMVSGGRVMPTGTLSWRIEASIVQSE